MKVIDLYNHAPTLTKALTRIGAVPGHWLSFHEQYRDLIKFGRSDTLLIHHCSGKQPYRARDVMECKITSNEKEKQIIVQELQGLINLLTKIN